MKNKLDNFSVVRRKVICEGLKASATIAGVGFVSRVSSATSTDALVKPVVQTAEGQLRGYTYRNLNVFKGIRYGEDTSGKNRFRPPVPVRSWEGVRDALKLGAPCPQDNIDTSAWIDPVQPSEDCLFLNVWAPRSPGKRPVMVFIHGGAYYWGSGGAPMYDGAELAERGNVVVVNINHRLNVFGYLYLGGLSEDFKESANIGQLDLVEALRWVKRNISSFGGDPSNVTIFGESGGGGKVSVLLAMPGAKGLFSKAIIESGSVLKVRTRNDSTEDARVFLKELGLDARETEKILDLPSGKLVEAWKNVKDRFSATSLPDLPFSPVLDAATVPYQPDDARALVLSKDVPLLVGTNEAESAYLLSLTGGLPKPANDVELAEQIRKTFPAVTAEQSSALISVYRAALPKIDRQNLLVAITSGLWMWGAAIKQAELKSDLGGAPVYMYQFGWKEPCMGGLWAVHAAELIFIFGKLNMKSVWDESDTALERARLDPKDERLKLRDSMIAAWSGFAYRGDPNNSNLPDWPRYVSSNRATMRLAGTPMLLHDPYGSVVRKTILAEVYRQ